MCAALQITLTGSHYIMVSKSADSPYAAAELLAARHVKVVQIQHVKI